MKQRLDTLLVDLNLCESRQQAQGLIRAGSVLVNQQMIDKPGTEVNVEAKIQVKQRSRFVSRGGEKLAKALEEFKIEVSDRVCLDGGISTGGFTDCLLKAGATKVYGVDVGYGQVDWGIRNDPRVVLKERTNLRYLTPDQLYGESDTPENYPDFAVVDVSFISLTKILPPLWQLLKPNREVVLLVKPQFEVGRERVGKKGVVRDSKDQARAIFQVGSVAISLGWQYRDLTWSPLQGPAGNIEYLLWLHTVGQPFPSELAIAQITQLAQQSLTQSQSHP
ncbi:TlyA family RNA methyltransferase [Planktothrix agardhii]|nr:TlyA family RNA methyltransferase [Planktothrix agardhii]MCB8782468.1 TlyA family RNA methyltransferase [Planktothrix agardhii 1808]MCF3606836.1 TlyA family RNA methyltransferase [Planktothrix agardhii 1033]BBD56887.1 hemolysin A [Planktothrix agardhii NIES-204]MCB8751088.1 TlyA family RNA methyltransferase [Planktothrix agardhii 1810]MCB8759828.1 TlyA family RNA methyltransferase [Planktothrix agardhii 1813]